MSEINKKAFRNCKKGQFYNIPSKKTDVASKPRYKFPFFNLCVKQGNIKRKYNISKKISILTHFSDNKMKNLALFALVR